MNELDGKVPQDYASFRKLPGVGDYSAAAVQSIAFDAPYAAVDGNIKRVLARLFLMDAPINDAKSAKLFQVKADELLDRNVPGLFNQAVMELGATVLYPWRSGSRHYEWLGSAHTPHDWRSAPRLSLIHISEPTRPY